MKFEGLNDIDFETLFIEYGVFKSEFTMEVVERHFKGEIEKEFIKAAYVLAEEQALIKLVQTAVNRNTEYLLKYLKFLGVLKDPE